MRAYGDKILVRLADKGDSLIQSETQKGEVVSIGHVPVGNYDPLKEGQTVCLETKAVGVPIVVGTETLHLFRKHQILTIESNN